MRERESSFSLQWSLIVAIFFLQEKEKKINKKAFRFLIHKTFYYVKLSEFLKKNKELYYTKSYMKKM